MSVSREVGLLGRDDTQAELTRLLGRIDHLLECLDAAESAWADWIDTVAADFRPSARNVAHYWAIRQLDLRDLQRRLAGFGLSSLGRSEPHVEATLRLVRSAVLAMLEDGWTPPSASAVGADGGREMLNSRTVDLLGPVPVDRDTRIMVTLPSEAATDPGLVLRLVERGMNVARINCAHDGPDAWREMASHVRAAAARTARPCLVGVDLAGPKLRTGPIEPGPRVIKLHPSRNALGHVLVAARAWMTAAGDPKAPPEPGMPVIPVTGEWLARRRTADVVTFFDTRGAKRSLRIDDVGAGWIIASTDKTAYLETGAVLRVRGADDVTEVGILPEREQALRLYPGDTLNVVRDCTPVPPESDDALRIGCTLPDVFDRARIGEAVLFDDGRIGGRIVAAGPDELRVRIERAAESGSNLRAGKGINLPDTDLAVSALTENDVADLATVAEIADFVELSFVQDPSDIERLHDALAELGAERVGVVLKIETRRAFEQLPQLVMTAMRRPRVGVMIARGDLAVEAGYERLAELQEEILWLCEAAHLPVIWATQVLEQLAKSGFPSRAEISDAAMGERAECVMLNKGPHIETAVVALDDILGRMAEHHYKKTALLPQLHSWHPGQSWSPEGLGSSDE